MLALLLASFAVFN